MTIEVVASKDVSETLCMVGFILANSTAAYGACICIEADRMSDFVMSNEHTIGMQQNGLQPADVVAKVT